MKRISIPGSATLKDLYDIAYKAMNLLDYGFSLFSDRGCSKEIRSTRSVTLSSSKLNHGDLIYYKQMAGSSVSKVFCQQLCNKLKLTFFSLIFSRSQRRVAHQAAVAKLQFQ